MSAENGRVHLHPYQREGMVKAANTLLERNGFYIQWDPGMGKTIGAIGVARVLKLKKVLVVAPVVALGVWKRQLAQWWPDALVYDETPQETEAPQVVLISYDKMKDPMASDPAKRRRTGFDRLTTLQRWSPDLLILDEAQYIKSYNSLRTRSVWRLAAACEHKLLLSGTPAHSPMDWWSQYKVIAPKEEVFRQTYQQFRANVMVLYGPTGNYILRDNTGKPVTRDVGLAAVVKAMDPYTHHADKSLLNLPEPVVTEVPVSLSKIEQQAYDDMEDYLRASLPDGTDAEAQIILTQMMRLSQISAGHVTNEVGDTVQIGESKLNACIEMLEERQDQKVVIACRFKEDIRRLKNRLELYKRPFRVIDGSVSAGKRTEAEDWFQKEEHNGVMILQYQAGGVAITLTAADALIMYTLDPSIIRWKQMLARVHRIGTTTHIQVLYLLGDNTLDWTMYNGLRRGATLVDMAKLLKAFLHRGT